MDFGLGPVNPVGEGDAVTLAARARLGGGDGVPGLRAVVRVFHGVLLLGVFSCFHFTISSGVLSSPFLWAWVQVWSSSLPESLDEGTR